VIEVVVLAMLRMFFGAAGAVDIWSGPLMAPLPAALIARTANLYNRPASKFEMLAVVASDPCPSYTIVASDTAFVDVTSNNWNPELGKPERLSVTGAFQTRVTDEDD
jgi:hypothetical protein